MPGSAGWGGAGGWSWTWACGQKRIHLLTRWTQTSHHRGTFISSTSQLGPLVLSPPPQPPGRRPLIRLGPSRAQCAALGAGLAGKRQRCVVWKGLMLPGLPGAPQSSAQSSPAAELGQGVGREPAGGAWLLIPGPPLLHFWDVAGPPSACRWSLPPRLPRPTRCLCSSCLWTPASPCSHPPCSESYSAKPPPAQPLLSLSTEASA